MTACAQPGDKLCNRWSISSRTDFVHSLITSCSPRYSPDGTADRGAAPELAELFAVFTAHNTGNR